MLEMSDLLLLLLRRIKQFRYLFWKYLSKHY